MKPAWFNVTLTPSEADFREGHLGIAEDHEDRPRRGGQHAGFGQDLLLTGRKPVGLGAENIVETHRVGRQGRHAGDEIFDRRSLQRGHLGGEDEAFAP